MTYLILGVVAAVVMIGFAPWIVRESWIRTQAREDYMRSRGTYHAREMRTAIRRHRSALKPLVDQQRELRDRLAQMGKKETKELERKLTIALVNESFLKIPGIGPKLKDRIVQACFDGTLESLLRANQVHGVGQEKELAIRTWVHQMKRGFRSRLDGDFAGKALILEKYE